MLLLTLLLQLAHADVPVVYTGSREVADAAVRKATKARLEPLEMRRLAELAPGAAPYIAGDPPPMKCTQTTLQAVREGLENATALMKRQADAVASLDAARLDLECLGEPVDPGLAAQLYFLRGFLSWRAGSNSAAEGAFYRALLFQPSLTWDEELGGPAAAAPFKAARARTTAAPSAGLRVVPPKPSGFSLRVDGRPAEVEDGRIALLPGVHLVQVVVEGETSQPLMVPLDPGQERALVLPVALSESLLLKLDDPVGRASLGVLMREAWPGQVSYATGAGLVWRFDPTTGTWSPL